MKDLLSILREAPGSIRLEVSGEDLLAFSSNLINRAKEELASQVAEARKVRFLTKEQVKELCGVCDATLWHYALALEPERVSEGRQDRQQDPISHIGYSTDSR